jgi:hypothetical protein
MTHLTAFLYVGESQKLGDHYIAGPRASEVGETGPHGGCAYAKLDKF